MAILLIAGAPVASALWLWMAWANRTGRSWARIVATVFFGVLTMSGLAFLIMHRQTSGSYSTTPSQFAIAFYLLYWLVSLSTIIFLWRRSSSYYYAAVRNHVRSNQARHPRH